jgi:cobalt/nickel transport system permease protein
MAAFPYFLKPLLMHIPDGFLNLPIDGVFWAISILMIALAVHYTQGEFDERRIPLMGVMAAFIFAAQMINFPIVGGTSGHLLGGALAAITLGPWAGILVMTSVIAVQGLLFQDGGLLVMGANIFNMGILTAVIGFGLYRTVSGRSRGVRLTVAGLAAWLSVMAGALMASLQLWLSGTALLEVVIPAMLSVHVFIGIGEALITVAALAFIMQVRPDLISAQASPGKGGRGWIAAGLLVSLLVVMLSPLASADPDGLERVAINLGFIDRSANPLYHILPDYTIPGIGHGPLSTILAGILGALIVAAVAILIVRLFRHPIKS